MKILIKLPSLITILLFFTLFYFNIISINCNSEDNSKILDVNIEIHPDVYSGWYTEIKILTMPNVTSIYSSYLNRKGNIFYLNVTIEFGEKVENIRMNSAWYCYIKNNSLELCKCYDLYFIENGEYYFLKEGNYSFILNINGKQYIKNFTINRKDILPIVESFPYIFWNGEEWILKIGVCSNLIPKKIYCLDPILIVDRKIFEILIGIEGWEDEIPERTVIKEYNYSLGILPEGSYWFNVYVNGEFDISTLFEVSRSFTTYVLTTYTTTETYTFEYLNKTITETKILSSKLVTTTIKVKESSEIGGPKTVMIIGKSTIILGTKTIQKSQTLKEIRNSEIKKEEFEIEQYTIPIFLFIIVIMITFFLYYILFKRREI